MRHAMISAMLRPIAIAILLGLPRLAAAQSVEVSGGYSLARDPRDAVTLSAGWMAGAAFPVVSVLSAVADASGQYATIALANTDATLTMHALLGGVRAAGRIGVLTEFAQVLAGVARASGSAFGSTSAARSFAVQPGIGIDYPLAAAWAVRAQFDVRLIRSQPAATNGGSQYRFVAALVYRRHPR
jgi:hypothetical protein